MEDAARWGSYRGCGWGPQAHGHARPVAGIGHPWGRGWYSLLSQARNRPWLRQREPGNQAAGFQPHGMEARHEADISGEHHHCPGNLRATVLHPASFHPGPATLQGWAGFLITAGPRVIYLHYKGGAPGHGTSGGKAQCQPLASSETWQGLLMAPRNHTALEPRKPRPGVCSHLHPLHGAQTRPACQWHANRSLPRLRRRGCR